VNNKYFEIPITIPDLSGNEYKYLCDAFQSTWISSSGEYINKFENKFSSFCESDYGIAVSNGTVAIHLALVSLGIKSGDEVIVPDLTFAATINAVLHANAIPVIVDIEKDSWCISPVEIEKAITPKTKAIIPVHLYGQPADMDNIMKIAKANNLFVIEDCAEAHGAKFNNRKVGSFGDIGCYSFFANKIITTGEGGMCVTNNQKYYSKMRKLRDHGMSKNQKYWHDEIGFNYRMTNLQAAIGVAQLERIEAILEEKKALEARYRKVLDVCENIRFQENDLNEREKITWLVSILVNGNRDNYLTNLHEKGIDARPFFYPLSIMPPYKDYLFSNKNSVEISQKGINLPTSKNVTNSILKQVKQLFLEYPND